MIFQEIAAALGIKTYPAVLEEYYPKRESPAFDFSLLGDYAAAAEQAAKEFVLRLISEETNGTTNG